MAKESYKDLKKKLDEIIEKMQDPATELDDALALHEEGKKLIVSLESYLKGVQEKVDKATKNS